MSAKTSSSQGLRKRKEGNDAADTQPPAPSGTGSPPASNARPTLVVVILVGVALAILLMMGGDIDYGTIAGDQKQGSLKGSRMHRKYLSKTSFINLHIQ